MEEVDIGWWWISQPGIRSHEVRGYKKCCPTCKHAWTPFFFLSPMTTLMVQTTCTKWACEQQVLLNFNHDFYCHLRKELICPKLQTDIEWDIGDIRGPLDIGWQSKKYQHLLLAGGYFSLCPQVQAPVRCDGSIWDVLLTANQPELQSDIPGPERNIYHLWQPIERWPQLLRW